ncbi:inositol monophosphatase [Novosphingobium sp. KCTC 2891]|uniref:inositol monophosphatase family protein n=1 Tax=Novosphingobium sp. KCTC 2891 TaxID=2989730 RepID=UPI002221ED64|nr:inositol monophosphatase family protein [Novosphingobium sp. KCTC 2891]MCW1384834.1 inositol monophosphatase [Novosphingobium sp. KCTC 2891]
MSETALDREVAALLRRVSETAILPRYQQLAASEINAKAVDDMVTVADTEAEAMLTEALARLLPEAAIVGEEASHANPAVMDRLGDGLCWIIDPLDGTNNFAAGKPPFGVLLALAQDGECVSGWIYDVLTGRLCSAHRGQGAFVDGERVHARTTGQEPPVAAISLVFMDPEHRARVKAHITPHYNVVDIPRCAAEQYPRLVLGVNDLSIFERTLAWDHAPGVLFVNEAGGKAARPDGSPYRVDRHLEPGLIGAASPALFDMLAEQLARLD